MKIVLTKAMKRTMPAGRPTAYPYLYSTIAVIELDDDAEERILNDDSEIMKLLRVRALEKAGIGSLIIVQKPLGNYGGSLAYNITMNKIHRRNERKGIPNEKSVGLREIRRFVL